MSLTDDRALVEAAEGVSIRDDAGTSPEERDLAFEVGRARGRLREHSAHLATLAKLKSAQEAAAHEQATDPLTRLQATLTPSAPDDVVIVGCGPKSNFFEFRRADGKRYQYTTQGPLACIPAADWDLETWGSDWIETQQQAIRLRWTLVCSAEHFNDLPKMLADAYDSQRFPVDIRANRLDTFLAIAKTTDSSRIGQLVAWYRVASKTEGPPYGDLAIIIRKQLAVLGSLGLILDEAAEARNNSSSSMFPYRREMTGATDHGNSTAMTREWAQRGERG